MLFLIAKFHSKTDDVVLMLERTESNDLWSF